MKYSLTGQQAFFFEKNGYIEFEQLFDDSEVKTLFSYVKGKQGSRNLARQHPEMQKILFSRSLAELAARLCLKRLLRYAFDQALHGVQIGADFSVARYSCIAPLAICAMICVDGHTEMPTPAAEMQIPEAEMQIPETEVQTPETVTPASNALIHPFPARAGSAVLFNPNAIWDPSAFTGHDGQSFVLFASAKSESSTSTALKIPTFMI